jgi:hypothetical protein
MGTPVDGGGKDMVGGVEKAGIRGWNGRTKNSSEMTGAGAGSARMPP